MNVRTSKGTALITGASRGIGAIYADRLAKRGYDLILAARDGSRLGALAARLAHETGRSIASLPANLGDKADLAKVEQRLREDAAITMLVNNAGVASVAPLLQEDIDKMERMIELNVTALTRLTYAAAPRFAERGRGTIINIASIVGVTPELLNGVYGASKAYVIALTQSLQHELADKGVRVQAVLPGATATDLWETAGVPLNELLAYRNLPSSIVMLAETMVDAALAGLDQGEIITLPGLHDAGAWERFEGARQALSNRMSNSAPAPRYLEGTNQAALEAR